MLRTHARLTKVPYQIFRHLDGPRVMLRRGARGSVELWQMAFPAPVKGGVRSVSDDRFLKLDAVESAECIDRIAAFYGADLLMQTVERVTARRPRKAG